MIPLQGGLGSLSLNNIISGRLYRTTTVIHLPPQNIQLIYLTSLELGLDVLYRVKSREFLKMCGFHIFSLFC